MGFWLDFGEWMSKCWGILSTPMTIGGYTFSLADVVVWSGIFSIIGFIVWGIIKDEV